MLRKIVLGGIAAGAIAVPLAGAAWAVPNPPNPTPPPSPGVENPVAQGQSQGQGQIQGLGQGQGPESRGPVCTLGEQAPVDIQGPPGATWTEVAQVPIGTNIFEQFGLTPGQFVKVYCTPAGVENPPGQQGQGQNWPAQLNGQGEGQGPQNPQGSAPLQQGQQGNQQNLPGQR